MYVCALCLYKALGDHRRAWIPWDCSSKWLCYRWLWSAIWVLEIKSWSSARAAGALNHIPFLLLWQNSRQKQLKRGGFQGIQSVKEEKVQELGSTVRQWEIVAILYRGAGSGELSLGQEWVLFSWTALSNVLLLAAPKGLQAPKHPKAKGQVFKCMSLGDILHSISVTSTD